MSDDPNADVNAMTFTSTTYSDTYPFISPTQFNLHGKTVLITGASKGIGAATAIAFAQAGASNLILAARGPLSKVESSVLSAAQTAGKPAPTVLALQVDVSEQSSVDAAAKAVDAKFGRVDILINNAGYLESFVKLIESDPAEWWKSWSVNVLGTYLVTRAFLPLLLKGEMKTVLNLSSIGAHRAGVGASAYQTTKLAIIRFSEFINAEYGDQGVLAFSVHPGGVPTELALNMPKERHAVLIDTPELAADSIVFLTAERREWLAGRYVSCAWDLEKLVGKKDEIVKNDLLKVRLAVR